MTDQLHDLLTRIADDAGPGPADPTLWGRARRARQVRRRRRAVALVAAGVAAVAALTAVGLEGQRHRAPDPVDQPDRRTAGPGVPSVVYGVPGDGGLALESDLAVGRASVAIANPAGAYVVTAEDGAYHRVRLPGYDAASYDAGITGMALSPDGTRLAYGYRSAALRSDERPRRTGLRVVDLEDGSVWTQQFDGPSDVQSLVSSMNVFAWDPRWSPDGRYLGASVAIGGVAGMEHWYAVLEPAAERLVEEIWHAKQWPDPPRPVMVSPTGQVVAVETDPRERLAGWDGEEWRTLSRDVAGVSSGRFSPDGRRLVLAGGGQRSEIAFVDVDSPGGGGPSTAALPERRYPYGADVDLLAWTGDRQVLALLRRGAGPTTLGPDADLALLTVAPGFTEAGDVGIDIEVVGRVLVGSTESAFSLATDLVTAESPTWDFDPPRFAAAATAGDGRG